MSSGWLNWSWYLTRMSYGNVIMSSGWDAFPFLSRPRMRQQISIFHNTRWPFSTSVKFSSNGFDVRSKCCCGGGGRGGRGSGGGGNELDLMADTYIVNMRLVMYRIWIWWKNLLKFIAVCRNKYVLLHAALCNREMLWCDLLQIF